MTMQLTRPTPPTPGKTLPLAKSSRRKPLPPQGVLIVSLWPLRLVCLASATSGKSSATPRATLPSAKA